MTLSKVMTADEAVTHVRTRDTVAFPGNASMLVADHLLEALERRFLASGEPRELTVWEPCNAVLSEHTGVGRFAHEGFVWRVICSAYPSRSGKDPKLIRMVLDNAIEGYNFPMGILYSLLREIGAGRPGLLTKVGLDTFVDPLHGGGCLNDRTTAELVRRMDVDGETYLFFRTYPIHIAFLKATTADTFGNLSMEREPLTLGQLPMALAVKASGGKVFAQVERIAARGTMSSRTVAVPGIVVDGVVLAPDAMQSSRSRYDPTITGEIRVSVTREPVAPGPERVILARAAAQFWPGALVNLGVGTADAVAQILWETGCEDMATFTTEHGAVGGVPLTPPLFGAHANADAIVDPPDVFNFYHAGGLDITLLGLAEADADGNVNVSRFGARIAGVGGFIDIAHATRDIYFCGPFAAKGAKALVTDGTVRIVEEGAQKKFVRRVQHLTFNGRTALRKGQRVHAITERGMMALRDTGWELIEIAPGLDPMRDLQPMMEFPLIVSPRLVTYAAPIMGNGSPEFSRWLRERIAANGASPR